MFHRWHRAIGPECVNILEDVLSCCLLRCEKIPSYFVLYVNDNLISELLLFVILLADCHLLKRRTAAYYYKMVNLEKCRSIKNKLK